MTLTFITALGVMILIVAFAFGIGFWSRFLFKKIAPDLKYWIKYKVFRAKHKEEDVKRLMEYDEANMNVVDVEMLLLKSGISKRKVKEYIYIYKELKKLKGGEKK